MSYLIAYVTILVVFSLLDAIWISKMALPLYRPILGNMMIEHAQIIPAAIFY